MISWTVAETQVGWIEKKESLRDVVRMDSGSGQSQRRRQDRLRRTVTETKVRAA